MTKSQIWWRIIQEETWNVFLSGELHSHVYHSINEDQLLFLILKVFSFGGYFEVKMILNVCCWGRSSGRFTLSKISCPLWRASKISHLKFYVLRHVANLLNECKITMDTSLNWIQMLKKIIRTICCSCWIHLLLMVVTAFVFRRGSEVSQNYPGLGRFWEPPAPCAQSPLLTRGLTINLGGCCAAFCKVLVLEFQGSEINVSLSGIKM